MDKKIIISFIVAVIVVLGGIYFFSGSGEPGTVGNAPVAFAQCLKDKGVKMYGAWWCPHCAHQKALFGDAAEHLPYVECSTPSKGQTQVCLDKQIESYPTWIFPNGERHLGVLTLEQLSDSTNCPLPDHTPNLENAVIGGVGTTTSSSQASTTQVTATSTTSLTATSS